MEFETAFLQAIHCLPQDMQEKLYPYRTQQDVEEIRLRAGQPLSLKMRLREQRLDGAPVSSQLLQDILGRATGYSLHSYTQQLRNGFFTLSGGHRLGLCGTAVLEDGAVVGLRSISSMNLRIACARPLPLEGLSLLSGGRILPTLLIAPPGYGKTTLLRALIASLSQKGYTVGVVDERGEIAGMADGVPQFALGAFTDVLDGCPKLQGVEMLTKTMSPQAIALDEISATRDVDAVRKGAHQGVPLLASLHASSVQDARQNPLYDSLFSLAFFAQAIVITVEGGARRYTCVNLKEEREGC